MKKYFSVLAFISLSFTLAIAQDQQSDEESETSQGLVGFWEIETRTGNFIARLDQISAVSMHEYYIDGSVKVYECSVDTQGGMLARFYYLEPVGAGGGIISNSSALKHLQNVANQTVEKVSGDDPGTLVTKHYPTTTHAKTAEFRFKKASSIKRIYSHARKTWAEERGRGKENKIKVID